VFREVGLKDFDVFLNSIGCSKCRPQFREEVRAILHGREDELCEDCRSRLERNVLRVLDCKNEKCREVVAVLSVMTDYLCEECAAHYEQVKSALERAGVSYEEDPHLVRGLDYYTRTVYEIKHRWLGARDAICGGGRYDDLVELLGGPSLPCVGFAIGAESTLLAMESEQGPPPESALSVAVYVVSFDDAARAECFELVQALRDGGVQALRDGGLSADMDYEGRSAKSQMRVANRRGAQLCVLIGPDELARGEVTIKDMADGRQWSVPAGRAVAEVRDASVGREVGPEGGGSTSDE